MLQSQLFTRTRHDAPKDEVAKNAQLLIRAGFIHKDMAGVYSYLPLGLRVIERIQNIIREELNALGSVELQLAALQDKNLWEKTGRWSDEVVDNWFKTKFKNEAETALAITHEEPLTNLMKDHIRSFRDLPVYAYQFQTKFRNEARAKSGIMRGREFLMKDLYSFTRSEEEHNAFYEKVKQAYLNIFKKAGLGDRTYVTFASGGIFSKYSHEFQTLTDAGEDTIYVNKERGIAINSEVLNDESLKELGIARESLTEEKAVEVGNIFTLGTRFSEALELKFTDEAGASQPVFMGSYGIGLPRVMGTIVEVLSDEKGLVWPASVAPFDVHVILLSTDPSVRSYADDIVATLERSGKTVLYDERTLRPGEKFADADLIGIPRRIIISEKTIQSGQIEVKDRATGEVSYVNESSL
ncbi:MAG: His/Gly/Thr/Pro-type tRNA ligase C-terminal domain-containing protein [Candidatus Pacebacteria bacterium]|nr:His/Gly/Thr/Pro-type tRNA ligase C-terminal domain-containing protein [Candidatus Paceibacterota bacterium]